MKRLLALIIVVFVVSGCRSQVPPAADPFFGRTRVAPPGTGSVSGRLPSPYYQGASDAPVQGRVVRNSPVPDLPAPMRSIVPKPSSTQQTTRAATPGVASSTLAGRERVIRVLQPRPETAASSRPVRAVRSGATPQLSEPRRLTNPTRAVDIMDLPPARRSSPPAKAQSASAADGFRLVSSTEEPGDSSAVKATAGSLSPGTGVSVQSSYGRDPDYAWLCGKLEYSEIDRRWKLRYIPIDGKTDKFGGSVVLSDPKLPAGCERGDFVEVHGKLGDRASKKGYAPTYEAVEIKRLGEATR